MLQAEMKLMKLIHTLKYLYTLPFIQKMLFSVCDASTELWKGLGHYALCLYNKIFSKIICRLPCSWSLAKHISFILQGEWRLARTVVNVFHFSVLCTTPFPPQWEKPLQKPQKMDKIFGILILCIPYCYRILQNTLVQNTRREINDQEMDNIQLESGKKDLKDTHQLPAHDKLYFWFSSM